MKKTFEFGKVDATNSSNKLNLVTLEVELKDKDGLPVFSVCGNVWNSKQSDIIIGGQCIDTIYREYKYQLSNLTLYKTIMGLWERNHLNDMNAGTPEQTEAIRKWEDSGNKYSYTDACEYLKNINLYNVIHEGKPYTYGHKWLYRPISEVDLKTISELLG